MNSVAVRRSEAFRRELETLLASGRVNEELSLVWHAGEPMALPITYHSDLFSTILDLAVNNPRISHSIQTNGMLINPAWCDFITGKKINIGVSLDGPAFIHDRHRKDRHGKGTHARVLNGVTHLCQHGIDFHVIAVITADTLDYADENSRLLSRSRSATPRLVMAAKRPASKGTLTEPKTRDILVRFDPELADRVNNFRHEQRFDSRNEAINFLVDFALKQKPKRT